MKSKKTILIKGYPKDADVRVLKEIEALKKAGFETTIMWWAMEYNKLELSQKDYGSDKILKLRTPLGPKLLFFIPIWWSYIFFHLLFSNYDLIHVINSNSALPAVLAARLKRKPVIYEIEEVYEDQIILPRMLRQIIIWIDKVTLKLATTVVLVDNAIINEFGGISNPNIFEIVESPPDVLGAAKTGESHHNGFTIFFGGNIWESRHLNLDKMYEAVKTMDGVILVIAGHGDMDEQVKKWETETPDKLKYLGKISYQEVLERCREADLLFELREAVLLTNKYTCGSKLFQAMMCGKPIIVNQGTSTAEKVKQEQCGLVVDSNNISEIRYAITKLKENDKLLREFGANARQSYEQKYSWQIAQNKLIGIYQKILMIQDSFCN